jgi:hypothetical protein
LLAFIEICIKFVRIGKITNFRDGRGSVAAEDAFGAFSIEEVSQNSKDG